MHERQHDVHCFYPTNSPTLWEENPQIYNEQEEQLIERLPFKRWILTMYRMGEKYDTALAIIQRQPRIAALTLWAHWYTPERMEAFRPTGVAIFVHTVNQPEQARQFLAQGVGLYTDSFLEKSKTGRQRRTETGRIPRGR